MENDAVAKAVAETVAEMNSKIEELKRVQNEENYSNEVQHKINEITEEVISFLSDLIERSKTLYNEVKDSKQLHETIAYMNIKSQEVYEEVLIKIEEVKSNQDINDTVEKTKEGIKKGVDKMNAVVDGAIIKLRQNDDFMNVVSAVEAKTSQIAQSTKSKIDKFASREDVVDTVEKVKDTTIDLSQKAVDKLRELLKKGDKQ